jgi:MoaA/NifB/PqqE/SkfB family radical SAM enzyme
MSFTGQFYIERTQPRHSGSGEVLAGWLTAPSAPTAAVLQLANSSEFHTVFLGQPRHDVMREVLNGQPGTAVAFSITLPPLPPSPRYARLWVQLRDKRGYRWYASHVDLTALVRNRVRFNVLTRTLVPPAATPELVARSTGIEAEFESAATTGRLLTLRLDLINKCNLRCVMCHYSREEVSRRPARSLSLDDFKRIFGAIEPRVRDVVLSCSDEPLMSKYFADVLRYLAANAPECRIMFCTNATLMARPARRAILESRVERVLLSIDGVTKSMFESIRVGAPFERVVGNIKALAALKQKHQLARPELVIDFVMMARNLHHAPAMLRAAHAIGVGTLDFRHVVMGETQTDISGESLTRHPARFNYYRDMILREAEQLGVKVYIPDPIPTHDRIDLAAEPAIPALDEFLAVPTDGGADESIELVPRPESIHAPLPLQEMFGHAFCTRPFTEVMVRNQDEVLPCPWHGEVMGRLSEGKDLLQIFRGEKFARLRKQMLSPSGAPGCRGCPLKADLLPQTLREFGASEDS